MNHIRRHLFVDGLRLVVLAASAFSINAYSQLPTEGGYPSAPDNWLVNAGQPWHHHVKVSPNPMEVRRREPTEDEQRVVGMAQQLLAGTSAKAIALLNGREVAWVGYKSPVSPDVQLYGFSIGKTVTAMAVGKAICSDKLKIDSVASEFVPELSATALGRASVRDLLTMRSGTWEGNKDSTIWTPDQAIAIGGGKMNWVQLLQTDKVSSAASRLFDGPRKPGEAFAYKSTDPLLLGVMLSRAVGRSYAQWVEDEVLRPAGIEGPVSIAQDRAAGFGQSDGALRMKMADWLRFAIWVRESESAPGCFGEFVRSSVKPYTATDRSGSLPPHYGYFTWVRDDQSWAIGHGGQRIAWNRRNARMLVAFSSVENYMPELNALYSAWVAVR